MLTLASATALTSTAATPSLMDRRRMRWLRGAALCAGPAMVPAPAHSAAGRARARMPATRSMPFAGSRCKRGEREKRLWGSRTIAGCCSGACFFSPFFSQREFLNVFGLCPVRVADDVEAPTQQSAANENNKYSIYVRFTYMFTSLEMRRFILLRYVFSFCSFSPICGRFVFILSISTC